MLPACLETGFVTYRRRPTGCRARYDRIGMYQHELSWDGLMPGCSLNLIEASRLSALSAEQQMMPEAA